MMFPLPQVASRMSSHCQIASMLCDCTSTVRTSLVTRPSQSADDAYETVEDRQTLGDVIERGTSVNALLIGESERGSWQLARRLEKKGFRWWFASTPDDIRALLGGPSIHLVLSTRPVVQGTAIMELLNRFACSVFYSYPIEDSCLWLLAAHDGRACVKTPVLRPSELASALDDMVRGLSQMTAA